MKNGKEVTCKFIARNLLEIFFFSVYDHKLLQYANLKGS